MSAIGIGVFTRDDPLQPEDVVPPPAPRFRPVSELFQTPEPLRWLVADWIEAGTFAAMVGTPGSGKTFVALSLAAAVATGTNWHRHQARQGCAWYVAGEGRSALLRRALAWDIRHKHALRESDNLRISNGAIRLPDDLGGLIDEIERSDHRPDLMVLDTLNRTQTGDENSTADATGYVQAIDTLRGRFGCAVLVLHHPSKANPEELRGSGALRGAVDSVMLVQANATGLTVTCTKQRSGDLPPRIAFGFQRVEMPLEWWPEDFDGHQFTVGVLAPADAPPPESAVKGLKQNQKTALLILQKLVAEHRAKVAEGGRETKAARVGVKDWRDACADAGLNAQAFRRAKQTLIERDLVAEDGMFVTTTEGKASNASNDSFDASASESNASNAYRHDAFDAPNDANEAEDWV